MCVACPRLMTESHLPSMLHLPATVPVKEILARSGGTPPPKLIHQSSAWELLP